MKFYVSTYTEGFFNEGPNGSEGIYLINFDEETNELKVLGTFSESINPSFIKLSKDLKNLYVACEKLPPSRIDSYKVNDDFSLTFNDSMTLNDFRSCCYMSVNKENNFIAVANYGSGEVFTCTLKDNKFARLSSSYRNDDSLIGPNTNRQDLPHAHSVRLIESLNQYVACDLGCDLISFYSYGNEGNFKKLYDLKAPSGVGPRHTINTKDGQYLYVSCELKNEILVYKLVNDKYELIQEISSLPLDFIQENTCADIHLSEDEKYIFVSNRGHDSIGQYKINEDHTLTLVKHVSCDGKGPRNFNLTNDYVICANQDSNDLKILELKDGLLTGKVLSSLKLISPVCIEKI